MTTEISRRNFMTITPLAVAGLLLKGDSNLLNLWSDKPNSKFAGVQMGVITYSFRSMPHDIDQLLQFCLDTNVSAMEMMGDPAEEYAGKPKLPFKMPAIPQKGGPRPQLTEEQKVQLVEHGKKLDYILGCTGCAPAAVLPIKESGLQAKIKVVSYDLTREIADFIQKGNIVASADTKGVSQARVTINAAVNFLEKRSKDVPHTILIKLGLVDQSTFANYEFDTSIAPFGYVPLLSYVPNVVK